MRTKTATLALTFAGLVGSVEPSLAMSGLGCSDLPLYYRAVGKVINGGSACNISLEEARAVLAREKGPTGATLVPGEAGHRVYHRQSE